MTDTLSFPTPGACDHPKCNLRYSATHPALPTRQYPQAQPIASPRCCVLIGEAPGYHEDQANQSWAGPAGKLLQGFLAASHLANYCDVYLANACRCRPPMNKTPGKTHIQSCKRFLLADLYLLSQHYTEVILFLQGATATHCILGCKLSDAFHRQNTPHEITTASAPSEVLSQTYRIFVTHHPAALLPSGTRKPQLIDSTSLHWDLLLKYLKAPAGTPSPADFFPYELGTPPYQTGPLYHPTFDRKEIK